MLHTRVTPEYDETFIKQVVLLYTDEYQAV